MIIFYVLLGLIVVRTAALAIAILVLARPVKACPACFEDTVPIRMGWWKPFERFVELRWCAHCGWQGIARRAHGSRWELPVQPSEETRRVHGTS